ncbi:hypothetical protein DFH08DRAFT_84376 [Mycena albidolilacea]|uniref:F-box domain-containing protein n=1 Tax=Mycena albidolilacea TaxID=1033008 RepID=A0AAD7EU99_9AGAR|nr:hypothetical protein DFH08DRAFT_84376 [Mycena albidolilacea]
MNDHQVKGCKVVKYILPTTMTSIPFDVLLEILPLVDSSDLPAMARTNRYISDFALDRMYGSISSKNMQAACQSVASNPSLARRVKSLEMNRHKHGHGAHLQTILPVFRDVLRATSNLRTLKLDIDGKHTWVLKAALGVFKLRSFSCSAYADQDLLDFLHDQTELEEIVFSHSYSFPERGTPVPWKFPGLKKVDGPMSWIDMIVPGQPVSHVSISYITPGSRLASLGLTTAPILHLQIPLGPLKESRSEALKTLFSSVEDLVLTTENSGTMYAEPSIPYVVQRVLEALPTVKDCRIIGYDPLNEEEHVVKTATQKAPAVRRFTMQFTGTIGDRRTICWTRGISGWNDDRIHDTS